MRRKLKRAERRVGKAKMGKKSLKVTTQTRLDQNPRIFPIGKLRLRSNNIFLKTYLESKKKEIMHKLNKSPFLKNRKNSLRRQARCQGLCFNQIREEQEAKGLSSVVPPPVSEQLRSQTCNPDPLREEAHKKYSSKKFQVNLLGRFPLLRLGKLRGLQRQVERTLPPLQFSKYLLILLRNLKCSIN